MLQISQILLSNFLTMAVLCSCMGLYTSMMNFVIFLYIAAFFFIRFFSKTEYKRETLKTILILLPSFSLFQYLDESLKVVSLIVFLFFSFILVFVLLKFFFDHFHGREVLSSKGIICKMLISVFIAFALQLIREKFKFGFIDRTLLCVEIYLGFISPITSLACLLPSNNLRK